MFSAGHTGVKDPLFFVALGAVAGIVVTDLLGAAWCPVFVALFVFVVASFVWLADWRRTRTSGLIMIAAFFALWHTIQIRPRQSFPQHLLNTNAFVETDATVLTAKHGRILIRTDRISDNQKTWISPWRLWLEAPGTGALRPGDTLNARGAIHPLPRARNPGQFDPYSFGRRRNINAQVTVSDAFFWKKTGNRSLFAWRQWSESMRQKIAATITYDLPPDAPQTALIRAMVLGMRNETSLEQEEAFRLSGALHLFAVSGLHVGMIGFVLYQLLRPGLTRRQTALVIIPLLFGYAFVTGMRPSALRAAVMGAVFLGGFVTDRPARLLNSLGAAALIVLLFDTDQIFQVGFQLSFGVLLAISLLARPINDRMKPLWQPDPFLPAQLVSRTRRWAGEGGRRTAELLAVSIAAWIGSMPFMIYYFRLLTPAAVIVNLVLVPLSFLVLFAALLGAAFALLKITSITALFNNANFAIVGVVHTVASTASSIPGSHYYTGNPAHWFNPPDAVVVVLDLPKGGASHYIQWRSGDQAFLDVGHSSDFKNVIIPFKRWMGIQKPDIVMLSHNDSAHIGGAPQLLGRWPGTTWHLPPILQPGKGLRSIHKEAEQRNNILIHEDITSGFTALDGKVEVLYPPGLDPAGATGYADDHCLVTKWKCASWSLLDMSDTGFVAETFLLNTHPDLHCDVLVRGTHDSDPTAAKDLQILVSPQLVIVDSTDPSFHHDFDPGHTVIDQKDWGAVTLTMDGNKLQARGQLGQKAVFHKRME